MGERFQNKLTTEFNKFGWDFIWPCCLVDIKLSKLLIDYAFIHFIKFEARFWLEVMGNFTFKMLLNYDIRFFIKFRTDISKIF